MGKDQEPKSAFKIPIRPRKKGHPEEEPATEETPELWVPPGFRETDAVPSRPKKHGTIPGKESVSMERRNRRKAGKHTEKATKNPRRRFHLSRKIAIASGVVAGFFLFWLASLLLPDKTQTPNPYPDPLKSKAAGQEQSRLFENALEQLRMGNSEEALQTLQQLEKTNPLLPSLSYHIALAALQYGDTSLAGKNADASIAKRERIADSLALKAVIETQKNRSGSLGDPAAAAEALLRQAASIEPGNPSPLIELSTILRHKSDHDGALELLKAARNRLNPVDSHAVADTTIQLLELQALGDNNLPTDLDPDSGTPALFSAAYVAMRTGRFADASTHLATAKKRIPADLFLYLVNDPALRRFKDQPEIAGFFD
jgi:tetratricopeptide (TPR) repeat protein